VSKTDPYHGFDEATLLEWIEGQLPPGRHRQLSLRIAQNPELSARLDAMRMDRFNLNAMGVETAPDGLLSAVADVLERDALLALEDGEPMSDGPPVSLVTPSRTSMFADRTGRRLAMAAGLLIVVGGLSWIGVSMMDRPPAPNIDESFALNAPDAPRVEPLSPAEPVEETAEPESRPTDLAARATDDRDRRSDPPELTAERAAMLLAEGRLIIRVRAGDGDEALGWVERLESRDGPIRITREVPRELASAIEPSAVELPVLAADDVEALPPPPEIAIEAIVLVEMPGDERTLAQALASLQREDGVTRATFEEVADPLAIPGAGTTPESVLWWRNPPETWKPRFGVPVVFETRAG